MKLLIGLILSRSYGLSNKLLAILSGTPIGNRERFFLKTNDLERGENGLIFQASIGMTYNH
jgi:hypothetical protein